MEIELKYDIDSKELMDQIWSDDQFASIEEKDSRQEIRMKAAYFDTRDLELMQNRLSFRIRKEGDHCVGTLKHKDRDLGVSGLYAREEINVPVSDGGCFFDPDTDMFKGSDEGHTLIELTQGKELICIFEMVFTRRKFRVDTGEIICEISLDEGEIIAGENRAPISELEIELFSGSKEDLMKIGDDIVSKYGLRPEPLSKYARGKKLIKGNNL